MPIFIRNTRTGLFYSGFNRWSFETSEAYDFSELGRAINWINAVNLFEVEIVAAVSPNPMLPAKRSRVRPAHVPVTRL